MEKILKLLNDSPLSKIQHFSGVKIGEKSLIIALKKRGVILVADFVEAVKLKRNLTFLGFNCEVISCGREVGTSDDENLLPFVSSISKFLSRKIDFLIFLPNSIVTNFDRKSFDRPFVLNKNDKIEISKLAENLVNIGYKRVDIVSKQGEFAIRGDIFDIFAISLEKPVRCDFFDNIIEKIAYFDPSDMKTGEEIKSISFYPAVLFKGDENVCSLSDCVVIDQTERLKQSIDLVLSGLRVMQGFSKSDYSSFENISGTLSFSLSGGEDLKSVAETSYVHSFNQLISDIKTFNPFKNKILLLAGESKNRIKNFLSGQEISFFDFEQENFDKPGVYVSEIYFPSSFDFSSLNLIAIGSDNLSKQKVAKMASAKKDVFYQPKIGEYVVHEYHGIGRCVGIERLRLSDCEKDYFVIEYRGGGMLYLPSEQASLISAYVGGESTPHMNSLGGKEFEQLKKRVKEKLQGFALELMKLYKEREEAKGFSFSAEQFLENEFANAFEFEPTQDQINAINEVLTDMASTKIMDRLLCGDVGFGKTEVAFRAIFRAVINSKQVAFLCPTTVLSEQHFLNAKKRFESFGVKIEILNRFKSQSQEKDILNRLKNGEIDVLIGTHKMLSKNVVFKDLGLLVIDEEQRFGVAAKEKIKNIRKNVDVLTLSATPIPRTLHMSLSGIRDISVIATPPRDRLPIQTYVTEEDDEITKSVLLREITRGGNAFVIYNRVQSIFKVASHISKLIPQAKIGVAHGQMNEKELQAVIDKLFKGEYNVFISTTLIENGIDLPSANTMIIYDADMLGLGQLYQLRGRIGRSDKLSYAYLFYKNGKLLTETSYKRLEAIKEFHELGSGFKVAMRDLEIRGAGNIFGKEQHGHIEKVGYDMFIKLLNETVGELSGQKSASERPVKIDLPLDAYIPETYLSTSEQRIKYYMQISEISSRDQMNDMLESLNDGFGDVPEQTKNLVKIAYIKNLAMLFGVKEIKAKSEEIDLVLYKNEKIADERLVKVLSNYNASLRFENLPIIKIPKSKSISKSLDELIGFFETANKS